MKKPIYEINIFKIFNIIKENKILFLFNIFVIPIIILIASFLIPLQYTSTALILSPEETFDPLLYGFSGIGEGMSSGISKAILGGGAVSELWSTILRSRTIILSVVDNLDLWERWDLETSEDAYKSMINVSSITITPEGVIFLNVTTDDPILSRDIALELILNLDRVNQQILQSTAANRKLFIEKRLSQIEDSMTILEDSMVNFNTYYGLIDIELEAEPILTALGSLKAQEILIEAELSALSSEQTALHPQRRSIEASLNSIRERINQIEHGGGDGIGLGFSVPLESLPSLGMEYARLKKDYLVQTEVFKLLVQEYERAKIAEQKDTPTLKVVDWPQIPEEKSYPKRSIFLAVGIFLGFSIGLITVILKNKFEDELKNNEVRKKWENIIYKW